MSGGGVHESLDGGRTWAPLLKGLEVVEGFDRGRRRPSTTRTASGSARATRTACISRITAASTGSTGRRTTWVRIGKSMPKQVGDIGFPMVVHPRDADTAWVFPMDGTTVWPRTSPDGKPAVYATRNGGKTWQRLDAGLPEKQAWWTVKRQAMTADASDPVGLYFGTTSGELWMSRDEGRRWTCIARHLPEIYAVEAAELCVADAAPMKVLIPSALRSYTEHSEAEASGATLAAVLADLDRRYPGIRFRMIDEQDRIRPPHPHLRQRRAGARPVAAARARPTRWSSCRR